MRRGVSPVLGVLLLVVIGVAIGLALWNWVSGYMTTVGGIRDFAVVEARYINTGGAGLIVVTVENTGTVRINSINVNPPNKNIGGLDPGRTACGIWTTTSAPTPGQQYRIVLTAGFSGGGSKVVTVTVTAEGA